jgi:hypothetical protein
MVTLMAMHGYIDGNAWLIDGNAWLIDGYESLL